MVRYLLLFLLLGTACDAAAQDWQLVWSDEFDTPGPPDPSRWTYDIGGHGWGNQELQYYTNRSENARVEDGSLILEAREEVYEGNAYTSARLVTRASWQYGRIEARLKLPEGQGLWPAFWMLPTDSPYGGWPAGGEIDIMEYLGHDTDRVYGTLHYGGGELQHRSYGDYFNLDSGTFAEDFHTFALEWEPRRMRWYVDGQLYLTQVSWSSAGGPYPAPFDNPFHVLLNVAVGGQWPGYPDATTTFPQTMEVDYVRVYADVDAYPSVLLDEVTVEGAGTITLAATASDAGEIKEVIFLQDGGELGADDEAPYAFKLDDAADGCYVLRARAIDDAGYVTDSDPVPVVVGAGCPEGSTSPYLMAPVSLPGTVEAEYFDLGGRDVAYFDFSSSNEGNGIRQEEGVDIRPSRDNGGGFDVTGIIAREWVTYSVYVTRSGTYRVMARLASGSGGKLRLAVDGNDLLGDVSISGTGGDVTYGNALLGVVELAEGRHELRLDMRSAGFSLNRLTFSFLSDTGTEETVDSGSLELRVSPNPSRARAAIAYRLEQPGRRELSVFDMLGRRVKIIASGPAPAGEQLVEFDTGSLAPGTYVCVLNSGNGIRSTILSVVR